MDRIEVSGKNPIGGKKPAYESPTVVDLSGVPEGKGGPTACMNGSSESYGCSNGTGPGDT
jgi:hypothetical protein